METFKSLLRASGLAQNSHNNNPQLMDDAGETATTSRDEATDSGPGNIHALALGPVQNDTHRKRAMPGSFIRSSPGPDNDSRGLKTCVVEQPDALLIHRAHVQQRIIDDLWNRVRQSDAIIDNLKAQQNQMVEAMGNDCMQMIQALRSDGQKKIQELQTQFRLYQTRLAEMEGRTAPAEQRPEMDWRFTELENRVKNSEAMLTNQLEFFRKMQERMLTASASGTRRTQNQLGSPGTHSRLLGPAFEIEAHQHRPSTSLQPAPVITAFQDDVDMQSVSEKGKQPASVDINTPDSLPIKSNPNHEMRHLFRNQPFVPPPLPLILESPVGIRNMIAPDRPEKDFRPRLPDVRSPDSLGTRSAIPTSVSRPSAGPPPSVSPKHDTAHIRALSPETSIGPSMPTSTSQPSVSTRFASPTPPMLLRSTTPELDPVPATIATSTRSPPAPGNRFATPRAASTRSPPALGNRFATPRAASTRSPPAPGNRSAMPRNASQPFVPPPLVKSSRPKGGAGTSVTPLHLTASIRASGSQRVLSSSSSAKLRGHQVTQLLATPKRSPSLSSHQSPLGTSGRLSSHSEFSSASRCNERVSIRSPGSVSSRSAVSNATELEDSSDLDYDDRLVNVEEQLGYVIDHLRRSQQHSAANQVNSAARESRNITVPAQRFKPPPSRVKDSSRSALLKTLRAAMNTAMGITKDKEIIQVQSPTEEEVGEYEEEGDAAHVQPSLDPMRPYLPVPKLSWNAKLWDLLLLDMQTRVSIEPDAVTEMEEAFYKRLTSLFRTRKQIVDNDDEEKAPQRREKELRTKQRQRASTRRQTLYRDRKATTEANFEDEDWEVLDTVVNLLNHTGISSDESETDNSGRKVYYIKKMPWRSEVVTAAMRFIDKDRNETTGNSRRPGNAPRTRLPRRRGNISGREAPPGLPINFYHKTWYDGLLPREKRELKAIEPFDLPGIDDLAGLT